MSTIRPVSSAEQLARRGGGPSVGKQVTLAGLGVACAGGVGWCLSRITSDQPPLWAFAAIPCGIVIWGLFLAVVAWSSNAALGAPVTGPLVVRPGLYLAAVCGAGGAAVLVCAQSRPSLPAAAYLVPLGLAVVFSALAGVGALRRGWRAAARKRARQRTHTTGLVTDDGLAGFFPGPNPKLARITVRFSDQAGQQRWVQPLTRQLLSRPLAEGDQVDVWYDASDPGNLRRIEVAADNGVSRIVPTRLR
ncbi:hypothetical protein [Nocardioides sp.]|uniref:hypothetical protein n=1 Tax=Nocardioides sp. TaxID=35761 RepID=UPI0039E5ECC5